MSVNVASAFSKLSSNDAEVLRAGLDRLDRFATLTDSRFRIPVIGVRFGIEGIIGLVPLVGDVIGALMSLYLFFEGYRLGAPKRVLLRMLVNIVLDFFIGLVPIVGDIADIAYKANSRNAKLLRGWVETKVLIENRSAPVAKSTSLVRVLFVASAAVLVAISLYFFPDFIAMMDLVFS
tara:strand:- start:138 stop:671 length:534 start_codon:yes stop_codon:yes gene_type:complete